MCVGVFGVGLDDFGVRGLKILATRLLDDNERIIARVVMNAVGTLERGLPVGVCMSVHSG